MKIEEHEHNHRGQTAVIGKFLLIVGLCVAAPLTVGVQRLDAQRPPQLLVTPPEEKRIIVEEEYQFTIRRYEPRVEVQLLSSPSQASFVTPEGTVIAFLSAAARVDLDWLASLDTRRERKQRETELSALDPQARREEEERYRKQSEALFKDRRIFLTQRVEVPNNLVVIEVASVPQRPGARVFPIPWTLTLEEGQWKMGVRTSEEQFVYRYIIGSYNFAGTERKVNPFPEGIAVRTGKPLEGYVYRFQEEGSKK